mgnify:FL=1
MVAKSKKTIIIIFVLADVSSFFFAHYEIKLKT